MRGADLRGWLAAGLLLTGWPLAGFAQDDLPVIAQVQAQVESQNQIPHPRMPVAGTTSTAQPDPAPAPDEGPQPPAQALGVLVLDVEQAYVSSAWGKRAQIDIEAAAREIEAENLRMEDQLVAEEQALAAERASLSPAEFRTKAEAFDTRAQTVRRDRRQAAVDLGNRAQADRNAFLDATLPIIAGLMQDRSAGLVLDRRQVLAAVNAVDVTQDLVRLMDQDVGDGGHLPALPPQPARDGSEDTGALIDDAATEAGDDTASTGQGAASDGLPPVEVPQQQP